jgi:hypothetical protein
MAEMTRRKQVQATISRSLKPKRSNNDDFGVPETVEAALRGALAASPDLQERLPTQGTKPRDAKG